MGVGDLKADADIKKPSSGIGALGGADLWKCIQPTVSYQRFSKALVTESQRALCGANKKRDIPDKKGRKVQNRDTGTIKL